MSDPALLTVWSRIWIDGLVRAGVRSLVLSPGSRSTPFVLAALERSELKVHTLIDERAAAFFALGQARSEGRPSLLLTTSGTAAGHALPALLEAFHAHVPLLLMTADRPSWLVGGGAPQTIDQSHLYGHAVRGFFDLGLPDESELALLQLRRLAAQVHALTMAPTPGPVHINARADKPLEPHEPEPGSPLFERAQKILDAAPLCVLSPRAHFESAELAPVAARIDRSQRGLIVAGPAPVDGAPRWADAVAELAQATGFPLYAEATSQLRFHPRTAPLAQGADALELLYGSARCAASLQPDLVIELGAPATSARYASLLASRGLGLERILIHPHGFLDAQGSAAQLIAASPAQVLPALTRALRTVRTPARVAWAESWTRSAHDAHAALAAQLETPELSEARVVRASFEHLPEHSLLMVGNSLAVRHLDSYLPAHRKQLSVLCQRGVAGIDGLIAGAAGAASVSSAPLTLLLGDVSALADLASLDLLTRDTGQPRVVLVLHNDGGRIFERLPIGSRSAEELAYFITPHGRDLAPVAQALGLAAHSVSDLPGLERALTAAYAQPVASLIEARVAPDGAVRFQTRLGARLAELSP